MVSRALRRAAHVRRVHALRLQAEAYVLEIACGNEAGSALFRVHFDACELGKDLDVAVTVVHAEAAYRGPVGAKELPIDGDDIADDGDEIGDRACARRSRAVY